ncbi:hypothetical protein EYR36_009348 [Pleurotus pulmonarius]|nr:hypothetical protein EYR36_009348 [Pleurotus pulmonarius]
MESTTNYGSLAAYKNWILAPPRKIPEQHAQGLYDHIEGLPEDLTGLVERARYHLNVGNTLLYNGDLVFQGRVHKVIIRSTVPTPYSEESFRETTQANARELKIWRLLRHPNILQFHGVCFHRSFNNTKGQLIPSLVLPYCENGSMNIFLTNHPRIPRLPLVRDVAKGLAYLHKYDIIHADIKPANILAQNSSSGVRAVIADFGSAKIEGELDGFGRSNTKTLRYVAPEFAHPASWIATKASDVCSFSFTALAMVSGKEPLADLGDIEATTAMAQGGRRPQRPDHPCSEMSRLLWALFEACWLAAPERRPGMDSVVAQLGVISTERTFFDPRMGSFSRRRKWRTTMADISPHVKILDDVKENASSEVQTLRGVYEDPTTNATIVLEIASALEYMHEQGVVHGSLNPSSILIADDGRPVIGNLSRAKILGRLGLTTHFTTDRYHAPETWMSKDTGGLTKESDVFSFGLVALFIISGRVPSWNTPATAPIKIDATKYPRIPVQWVFADVTSPQDNPAPPTNPYLEWAFAESLSHSVQELPDTWEDVGALPNDLRGMVVYKPSFMQQLFGISSGGFATVYGGQLTVGERIMKVVIKCMHRSSDDVDIILDQNRKRFAREIRVARKLIHPNIVRFYGICSGIRITMGEDDPALIFEYCEGHSITDYLKKNPETSRLPLIINVAAGLSYMHANGIIHGDLKPNNVFIKIFGDNIRAVLGDFGSARILDVDMPSVVRAGHARYDAPEIAFSEDDAVLTKESDVFAFSLTALAIVTGRELLQDEDTEGLHERIATHGERPLRSDFGSSEMSDKLWETLEKCWNQEPSKRLEISQVLSELRGLATV